MNKEYKKSFTEYNNLIKIAIELNHHINKSKVSNTSRLTISKVCLAKMIIQCSTVIKLLPYSKTNYDISTFLATGRSIFELSNNCFFYGSQKISKQEEEFRLLLFNYIAKKERINPLNQLNVSTLDIENWELTDEHLKSDKAEICNHPLFTKLIIKNKYQGFDSLINSIDRKNKYNNVYTISKERNLDMSLIRPIYSVNSSFLHNSPAAIYYQILKLNGEPENENDDLKTALIKATIPFSLLGLTISEIYDSFAPDFKESIKKSYLNTVIDYSNNLKKK